MYSSGSFFLGGGGGGGGGFFRSLRTPPRLLGLGKEAKKFKGATRGDF